MMAQLFLNNFETTFIAPVKDTPTTATPETELDYGILRISDGAAGALINPSNADYYILTAFKRAGTVESDIEIMRVTAVDNSVPGECRITVLRAQEGTTPKAYVAGDRLALRLTAGAVGNLVQDDDPRLTDARAPTGGAGGVLSGSYPNPGFAVDMATQAELDAHTGAASNAHAASAISNTPAGNISSTTVQDAINELDAEKQAVLVSGTNIKTVNGESLLGAGDLTNLDAGTLDGHDSTYFLPAASYTAADVLAKVKTVDGAGSGLDADLLDGKDSSEFQETLVSGVNIKTVNGQSLLGPGDVVIQGGVGVTLSGDPSIYVNQTKSFTITNYNVFSSYAVQVSAGSVSITGDTINFTAPSTAQTVALTVTMDDVATVFSLSIQPAGVETPVNISPANGAVDQNGTVTLTASAFQWVGVEDTHLNSDWQLATDVLFTNIIQSSSADTTNLTSWTVSGLSTSQTYYWRVRYRGANNGVSAWSTPTSFTTKATFAGLIGVQGEQGFGVGEYPDTLPSGFSTMLGTSDKASDNYGIYQYSDGSVMVFVPRFYYRIGSPDSPRYATYGANAIDIAGIDTFATEAEANAAGYALHRAFIDGGQVKSGFFIDKYIASKNGSTSCKSVKNGVPISLVTTTTYTNSNGMTTSEGTCTGIYADAVLLARSRGIGTFNTASVFMYSALALLSLAHAQASTNSTYCAWYDATNNFPKGCNNNALADVNDTSVTFTSAGDSGSANKPLTGSGTPFAKTTHNGQNCGVADLNGAMWEVALGITNPGTSATDTTQITNGDAYVLKESVALASLTHGWNGTNDAWGDAANLATKYDLESGLFPWGSATGAVYFGNGANEVFSGATSGTNWKRTACGIQSSTNGTSATGTNLFGNDYCYQYNRHWFHSRSSSDTSVGFRACAYGT